MLSQTPMRPKYRGVPLSVETDDPTHIIFSGKPNTPFVSEITNIEQLVEDCRTSISRYLGVWEKVHKQAQEAEDTRVLERAHREIDGLYNLLKRLERAVQ